MRCRAHLHGGFVLGDEEVLRAQVAQRLLALLVTGADHGHLRAHRHGNLHRLHAQPWQ